MKSNILFILKMLKNEKIKSTKIKFNLKLYIIEVGQIKTKSCLNPTWVFKIFSNSSQSILPLSQTLPIKSRAGRMAEKTYSIATPILDKFIGSIWINNKWLKGMLYSSA